MRFKKLLEKKLKLTADQLAYWKDLEVFMKKNQIPEIDKNALLNMMKKCIFNWINRSAGNDKELLEDFFEDFYKLEKVQTVLELFNVVKGIDPDFLGMLGEFWVITKKLTGKKNMDETTLDMMTIAIICKNFGIPVKTMMEYRRDFDE